MARVTLANWSSPSGPSTTARSALPPSPIAADTRDPYLRPSCQSLHPLWVPAYLVGVYRSPEVLHPLIPLGCRSAREALASGRRCHLWGMGRAMSQRRGTQQG